MSQAPADFAVTFIDPRDGGVAYVYTCQAHLAATVRLAHMLEATPAVHVADPSRHGCKGHLERWESSAKVYIVLEHPDMTYYGEAEIHAVEDNRDAAIAKARTKTLEMFYQREWRGDQHDRIQIEEWEMGGNRQDS
jgi:hypothetical protein